MLTASHYYGENVDGLTYLITILREKNLRVYDLVMVDQ